MAFSQEIRFKIGADTTELKKGMQSAGAVAQATGKKIDDVMKGSFTEARKLADFRDKQAYKEANTTGKLKLITADIAKNVKDRNKFEEGSTEYLKRQLSIEEKVGKMRELQRKAAKERLTSQPKNGAQGDGSGAGAMPGLAQIGEGLLKRTIWMGAGTIFGALVNALPTFFQRKAAQAERQEDVTSSTGSSLTKTLNTIGGLQKQVGLGRREFKDLEVDIAKVKSDIEDLTGGPYGATMDLINPIWQGQVDKLREKLAELTKQQTEVGNETQLASRQLERQTMLLDNEAMTIEGIDALNRQGRANSVKLAQQEASKARMDKSALVLAGAQPFELKKAGNVVAEKEAALTAEAINARQRLRDVSRDLAGQAAQGRTFDNGRSRPRSESERLAQQAERARDRSRSAVLTGAAGEAALQMNRARRLEGGVAERLALGSSQIEQQGGTDLGAVKTEIATSNQILSAIKASLVTQTVE